jgi:DNA-binding response OmpR family regulator
VSETPARILIADDEPNLLNILRINLERSGFLVTAATDGQEAYELAQSEPPDVIVLDVMMPGMDGRETCRRLRANYRTRHIPILLLTALKSDEEKVTGLEGGANDYLTKPYATRELVQRIKNHLDWSRTQRSVSPLTGLPGNLSIVGERDRRVTEGKAFAQIFLDLDSFKAFNDRYGFARGDVAIKAVAEVLVEVLQSQGHAEDFVGHIGGDDFCALTSPEHAEDLAEAIKIGLDARFPALYDDEDRAQGFVRVLNRRHEFENFPLMSVTIAVAEYDPQAGGHLAQLDDVLKELKEYGKTLPGSVVVTERRRKLSAAETSPPPAPASGKPPRHANEGPLSVPPQAAASRKRG